MVLKKSKHDINSGNSFKFGRTKTWMKHEGASQHVITKLCEGGEGCMDDIDSFIDDGALSGGEKVRNWRHGSSVIPMQYSMNRRKRWQLADQLKTVVDELHEILQEGEEPPFSLAITEFALKPSNYSWYNSCMTLKNDCIGYHDSQLPRPHVQPSHHFSLSCDLQQKAEARENHMFEKSKREQRRLKRKNWKPLKSRAVQRKVQLKPTVYIPEDEDFKSDVIESAQGSPPKLTYGLSYPQPVLAHRRNNDCGHKMRMEANRYALIYRCKKAFGKVKCMMGERRGEMQSLLNDGLEQFYGNEPQFTDQEIEAWQAESDTDPWEFILDWDTNTDATDNWEEEYLWTPERNSYNMGEAFDKAEADALWEIPPIADNKKIRKHPNPVLGQPVKVHPKGSAVFLENKEDMNERPKLALRMERMPQKGEVVEMPERHHLFNLNHARFSLDEVLRKAMFEKLDNMDENNQDILDKEDVFEVVQVKESEDENADSCSSEDEVSSLEDSLEENTHLPADSTDSLEDKSTSPADSTDSLEGNIESPGVATDQVGPYELSLDLDLEFKTDEDWVCKIIHDTSSEHITAEIQVAFDETQTITLSLDEAEPGKTVVLVSGLTPTQTAPVKDFLAAKQAPNEEDFTEICTVESLITQLRDVL